MRGGKSLSQFDQVVHKVLEYLSQDSTLQDIHFLFGYPPSSRPYPRRQITASLGLQGVELLGGGLGGYLGTGQNGEILGTKIELSVSVLVLVPPQMGGEQCTEAFSRICASLTQGKLSGIQSVSGGALQYDANGNDFRMQCTVKLRLYWGMDGEPSPPIQQVTVKGVAT